MSMQVLIQSKKYIKPATPTPQTLGCYKISCLDEQAPATNISIVLFFSINSDQNPKFVAKLEKSLERILPSFYPLAGRYLEEIHVIECKDQGVEFIQAKANTKLQDFIVDSETNVKLVDDLIPFVVGAVDQVTDPILGIQATTFECGGLALGVSMSHRIADASTLCTFLNKWAATSREENQVVTMGFNSSKFFPGRGLTPSLRQRVPRSKNDDAHVLLRGKYTTKKLSFSDSDISHLKNKIGLNERNAQYWSKVQLVSAVIWKALIEVDQRTTTDGHPRDAIINRPINLRRKDVCLIPKDSCGNLYGLVWTEWKNTSVKTTRALGDLLRDDVTNFVNYYLELRHDIEKVQTMVMNSLSRKATNTASLHCISSWCNFPFYEADYGFGKPVQVSSGSLNIPVKNLVWLLDGVGGKGVDAYLSMEQEDIPFLEEAVRIKDFVA
uniref:pelargonidin 3-O-(6-caffeoylglucoside) 5-O-(6-O-malonylglucoside) 4'''-malonyltransferase-like n=1 Tax=Erigeron canadensis TaxID=72917 RepID=UPI001CB93BE5|nr:pelargonidin 3-O-(6-caffeoylglucoside) 5-O-(6-O-malonylglucoside) 4'''-malonyltransferase-like [Erigeron canadensis]